MNASTSLDDVRRLMAGCEAREQARRGGSLDEARSRLADRLRVLPGTLYNLARDRLKRLDGDVRDRLTAYAVRDLSAEIARLNHELELAQQMGAHVRGPHVGEVERHLAAARALIAELPESRGGRR